MKARTRRIGNFGLLVKNYVKARTGYPSEIFRYLKRLLKVRKPLILDLGCGTGISTRQLAKLGRVIGCDKDPIMLKYAKSVKGPGVKKYILAVADNLPFEKQTFDLITAFSSFHWFDDKKSVAEMYRVLRPGGLLFVANKSGTTNFGKRYRHWGEGYRQAIIKTLGQQIARFKEDFYDPKKTLKKNGFKQVKVKKWKGTEFYTLPKALQYVQSVSIWNSVPEPLRRKALAGLVVYFKDLQSREGKIGRGLNIQAISGVK